MNSANYWAPSGVYIIGLDLPPNELTIDGEMKRMLLVFQEPMTIGNGEFLLTKNHDSLFFRNKLRQIL